MKTHRSNDLAFIDHYVDHLTSVVPVNAVFHSESERHAVQIKIRPAFLVYYHLFQQLTVNLCAVTVRRGCFLNIGDVAPDPVKLLLVGGVDVLAFCNLFGKL